MFEPHAERLVKLPYDIEGGVGILDIVVGKLLAVKLLCRGEGIRHLF